MTFANFLGSIFFRWNCSVVFCPLSSNHFQGQKELAFILQRFVFGLLQFFFSNSHIYYFQYKKRTSMQAKANNLSQTMQSINQSDSQALEKQDLNKKENQKMNQTFAASPKDEEKIKCRSIKKKVNTYEISFEQSFIHEHHSSLLKISSNYIESCLKQPKQIPLSFVSPSLFGTLSQLKAKSKLDIQGNSFFGKIEKEQYKKDLIPQDKLTQFLELLQTQFPSQVAEQFLFISYFVWEKYLQIRKPLLKPKDFRDIAQQFSSSLLEKIFFHPKIKFINLKTVKSEAKKPQADVKQSFRSLLSYFSETIFLIIEGYFQNPYFQGSQKLENSSDQEFRSDSNSCFSSQGSSLSVDSHQKPNKMRKFY